MTTHEPQVNPAALYESKAACEALGISRQTLARYARTGMIKARVRASNNRRVFKGCDIIRLWRYVY